MRSGMAEVREERVEERGTIEEGGQGKAQAQGRTDSGKWEEVGGSDWEEIGGSGCDQDVN